MLNNDGDVTGKGLQISMRSKAYIYEIVHLGNLRKGQSIINLYRNDLKLKRPDFLFFGSFSRQK